MQNSDVTRPACAANIAGSCLKYLENTGNEKQKRRLVKLMSCTAQITGIGKLPSCSSFRKICVWKNIRLEAPVS